MDEVAPAERHALLVHIRLGVFHRRHRMLPMGMHHRTYARCPEKLGNPVSRPLVQAHTLLKLTLVG
jgi:hypothetical protein